MSEGRACCMRTPPGGDTGAQDQSKKWVVGDLVHEGPWCGGRGGLMLGLVLRSVQVLELGQGRPKFHAVRTGPAPIWGLNGSCVGPYSGPRVLRLVQVKFLLGSLVNIQ